MYFFFFNNKFVFSLTYLTFFFYFVSIFFICNVFIFYLNYILINFFFVSYIFFLGNFNLLFLKIVLIVCLFVYFYITVYFFFFDNLFFFFIIFVFFFLSILLYLVSLNMIFVFIFWELMGVCSFFLISSFFCRYKTRSASFLAFFYNLLGDLFLLLFFILNFIYFYFLNILSFFFLLFFFFLIFFAIFCKSAVYPFHNWLYLAMEGPTPVSAFLHAASMITAGVYFFFILPLLFYNYIFIFFGFFTTLFFSLNAFNFFDVKRIIASSTGSQLGYIFFFFSFNLFYCGLLLFTFHAVFKSLLFFLAGFIISLFYNYQDLRFFSFNVLTLIFFFFCFFSLVGLFFFWCGIIKEFFLIICFDNFLSIYLFVLFFVFSCLYFINFFKRVSFSYNFFNLSWFIFFSILFITSFFLVHFLFNILYNLVLPKFLYFFILVIFGILFYFINFNYYIFDLIYFVLFFFLGFFMNLVLFTFKLVYFIFYLFF